MTKSYSGWRLATIRGVDLKVHPSLAFLLVYVMLVAGMQFPSVVRQSGVDPAQVGGGPMAWGLLFALALFVSVTLHEFGHVIVAQALGVKVKGVTLMMLGGISEMERIPEERLAEFKVAVVGPLVSFAIAGALIGMQALSGSPALDVFGFWLARVNIALGAFNLLPAFPLDGGRAFRSLLASRKGQVAATEAATGLGRGLAWALGLLGLLTGNFMLMIVAVFIHAAASSELALTAGRGALEGVPAGDAATRVEPLSELDTLGTAAVRMMRSRSRALPVSTSIGPGAVLAFERLRSLPRSRWGGLRVRDLMERSPRAVRADEPLEAVLPELAASGALPLEEDGRITGILRHRDLAELVELRSVARASREAGRRAS